ncbi:D-hexose-6-phosphate mutarotase [Marinomonas agarivorans]|nr:D-hexose-6-phosphate mutarotase [Marinomonas agarivorans]
MDKQLMDDLEQVGGSLIASNLRGCDEILIEQPQFSARIALWGGHLVSFVPTAGTDILFQSEHVGESRFDAQHMGVPVCWPWFAEHGTQEDYPIHGLVRYLRWQLADVDRYKNGDVKIILKLNSNQHPIIEDMCPQAFELRLVFRLGDGFRIDFFAANLSDQPMLIGEALHTYFYVADSNQSYIEGLNNTIYIDKLANNEKRPQVGPVTPCVDFDRVYFGPKEGVTLVDPVLKRKVHLTTEGSANTVLWNPGVEGAKSYSDMHDEEYKHFVCIETANALDNTYELAAGEIHQLRMMVKVETLD